MLTPPDVLDPVGLLDPEILWPALDPNEIDTKVRGYLTAAYNDSRISVLALADQDDPVRLYVYWRAWLGVHDELVRFPASRQLPDQPSGDYLAQQIADAAAKAEGFLDELEELLEDLTGEEIDQGYGVIQSYR